MKKVYFVSGIDTNIGKSYATGYYAKFLMQRGERVITQKMIQTGGSEISEDVLIHRKVMGIELTHEDSNMLTMPQIFAHPSAPSLSAKLEGKEIDFERIDICTDLLSKLYDKVLVEGSGGLMCPLTKELLTIDYIANKGYPLVFVTSAKLGSISHTLLSFEAIRKRNIKLEAIIFNQYDSTDPLIAQYSMETFISYAEENFPMADFIQMPIL